MSRTLPLALLLALAACARPAPSPALATPDAPSEPWPGAAVEWSWTGGSPHTDWITRVIETRDGSLVAVGFVERQDGGTGPANWEAVAMKLDAAGRVRWSRRYGGPAPDAFWDVRERADGTLAVAGFSASGGAGASDAWFVLLDADGGVVRERRFGGAADDRALGLALAPDGGVLLVGETRSFGAGERDVLLVRTDPAGDELWRRAHGGAGVDRGFFAERTRDGFVVAGVTGTDGAYDILTLQVDERGAERWRDVTGGPGNDPNHGLRVLPDGRILVVGYAQSWDSAVHDLVALTFSPDGALLRHELLGGVDDDRAMSAVPAADGGSWLVGYTRSGSAGGWDVMVARVAADGAFEPWLAALGTVHDDNAYAGVALRGGDLVIGGYTTAPSRGAAPPDLLLSRIAVNRLVRRTDGVRVRRVR